MSDSELFGLLAADGTLRGAFTPPPAELARALHRHMLRVRRLDERFVALQRQGRIGFHGSCTGQEAPPVAAALAVAPTDWVFPALRETALLLARGFPLELYLAQSFGNSLDLTKGRQMPSHPASRRLFHVSWSSVIATQLPHAVGAAMAARRLGRGDVMIAFMGDGATSHPDFHAALNFAGVFRAPVVFVCQNNQYAISVPASRQTAAPSFAMKGDAYGVSNERVDGNDALAIHHVLSRAIEGARRGEGPRLVECLTYRIGPHSSSDDPTRYRDEQEVERYRSRDPIARLSRYLVQAGLAPSTLDDDVVRAVDAEFDAALARVESAPPPALASLFEDVYERTPWHLSEQLGELVRGPQS